MPYRELRVTPAEQRKGMVISMRDEKEQNVDELAEALESRLTRKEETDGLEEIDLDDFQEEWVSEEIHRDFHKKGNSGSRSRRQRRRKGTLEEKISEDTFPEVEVSEKESSEDAVFREEFPEEDFPEDDWEDDEEAAPMNPWVMAAVMAGLIVLAAIICAILWHFTHLDKEEDSPPLSTVESEELSGKEPEDASLSGEEASSQPSVPETASLPETVSPSPVPAATSTPTAAPTPAVPQTTISPGAQASAAVQEPISGTTAMEFTQITDEVMPKDVINLRSEPSTLNADNIVAQAQNGDILSRTGVNQDTGWSRIDHDGEILYAVSQYLTTDLTYKPPVQAVDPNRVNTMDGRIILFIDCNDNITPKEYVNLRTEPSTSEGETTVRCQISNGEVVHRTGYSPDAGWSRVEYNGEVLYVVSSYMYTVE